MRRAARRLDYGTSAQPDRAASAAWWDAMWAASRATTSESIESAEDQWQLCEQVKFAYLDGLFPAGTRASSLECGCGAANVSLHFAERGYRVVMLDFAPSAIGVAARNFGRRGQEGEFVRGDVNDLPFAANSFDVVTSFGLIEHFVDVRPIVREMVRVLKPGGLLFMDIVPKRFNVQTVANVLFNFWAALAYGAVTAQPRLGWTKACSLFRPPYFENAYSLEQYEGWMAGAGLARIRILGNNPFPRLYLPGALDRLYIRLLRRWLPSWRRFDAGGGRWAARYWARAWWAHGYKVAEVREMAGGSEVP